MPTATTSWHYQVVKTVQPDASETFSLVEIHPRFGFSQTPVRATAGSLDDLRWHLAQMLADTYAFEPRTVAQLMTMLPVTVRKNKPKK